jgi:hypothetical protein
MKILIGIKEVSASGSFQSSLGHEGFNITASNVTILGTAKTFAEEKELILKAEKAKQYKEEIKKLYEKFDDDDYEFFDAVKEINEKYGEEVRTLTSFNTLILIDGVIL